MSEQFAKFAEDHKSSQTDRRRPLARPNKPLHGSTAERKLDIGFLSNSSAGKDSKCLVSGELKSNPSADTASKAWLDLGSVGGKDDNIRSNIRGGLDITKVANYRRESSILPPSTSVVGIPRKDRSSSNTGRKRLSSRINTLLPPGKRSCSSSLTKAGSNTVLNRVHRRVIVRDYGKAIYKTSSRAALLKIVDGCIEGHESLYTKASIL
ncbi:unnamed protein product [Sphagnum compactum]